VFEFFDECKQENGNCLVHCQRGISRSSSLVIAYLMYTENQTYTYCKDLVKSKRHIISPNVGFMEQLKQWRQRVTCDSRLDLYRIVPSASSHPDIAMLACVVKMPSVTALDARATFALVCWDKIYIWVGSRCKGQVRITYVEAAYEFVARIQKYERASETVVLLFQEAKEDQSVATGWARGSPLSDMANHSASPSPVPPLNNSKRAESPLRSRSTPNSVDGSPHTPHRGQRRFPRAHNAPSGRTGRPKPTFDFKAPDITWEQYANLQERPGELMKEFFCRIQYREAEQRAELEYLELEQGADSQEPSMPSTRKRAISYSRCVPPHDYVVPDVDTYRGYDNDYSYIDQYNSSAASKLGAHWLG
jgi:dual specificity MAP kinase phosphatase